MSSGSKACTGKKAASVLLKLFIMQNEKCHTINAPLVYKKNYIFKPKQLKTNLFLKNKKEICTLKCLKIIKIRSKLYA